MILPHLFHPLLCPVQPQWLPSSFSPSWVPHVCSFICKISFPLTFAHPLKASPILATRTGSISISRKVREWAGFSLRSIPPLNPSPFTYRVPAFSQNAAGSRGQLLRQSGSWVAFAAARAKCPKNSLKGWHGVCCRLPDRKVCLWSKWHELPLLSCSICPLFSVFCEPFPSPWLPLPGPTQHDVSELKHRSPQRVLVHSFYFLYNF